MTGRLEGKKAIVTAAAQGIGRAIAEAFAREGASVIAADINGEKLGELKNIIGLKPERLDVLDRPAITTLAREAQNIDILVNCAGFVHSGTILQATDEEFTFAFDLNVRSMMLMLQAFLPRMIENGGGAIINIASVVSSIKGVPNRAIYGASKAAVIGLTKSVAADFIKQGIRCNAICPGTVESPSLEDRLHATGDYEKARTDFIARQPMGRLGKPEEVAELAVYLASDLAAFTTGQTFVIDGGMAL